MRWLLIPISLVLLSGCADRSLAGFYKGKREVAGPPHIAGQLAKVELDLRKDGTFELLNTSISFSGDWEYKDGKIILEVKAALNRPAQMQTKPYLVPKSGGLEFNDPSGSDPTPVLLTKVDKL